MMKQRSINRIHTCHTVFLVLTATVCILTACGGTEAASSTGTAHAQSSGNGVSDVLQAGMEAAASESAAEGTSSVEISVSDSTQAGEAATVSALGITSDSGSNDYSEGINGPDGFDLLAESESLAADENYGSDIGDPMALTAMNPDDPAYAADNPDNVIITDPDELAALVSNPEEGIDVDLTRLNSVMVYSQVYEIMYYPEDFIGKVIRMTGTYSSFYDESTGKLYNACIIQDATACCAQGIEFILTDDYQYPEDYPKDGDEVTVTGTFDIYGL